MATKEIV